MDANSTVYRVFYGRELNCVYRVLYGRESYEKDPDDGCHANEHTEYWGDLSDGMGGGAS